MEDIEDVADRLRRNETGYSCLDVKMNPGFEVRDINLLMEAVLANETLTEVNFFGILGDIDKVTATRRLFESFATLPKLEKLQLFGYCADVLATLNHVLRNRAPTLRDLKITYVHLHGSDDVVAHFQQSLQDLTRLQSFNLVDCQFSELLRDTNFLDQTLTSLSKLPTLENVSIKPLQSGSMGYVSTDPLVEVCKLPKLTYLSILGLSFPKSFPHLGQMMSALRCSGTIQDLSLQSSTSKDNCTSIGNFVREAKVLKFLHIRLSAEGNEDAKHILKIGEALQENTSLKTLALEYRHSSNTSIGSENLATFGMSLAQNYSLEKITFLSNSTPGIEEDPLVSMYLRLNRLGRGKLIRGEQTSRQQWVEKLLESHDYLDGMYYFLSMNPLLCEVAQPT